mmetsp:Transcript_9033/g.8476  ORF Transcript_9033/g.8476 Transcript_9033/m.8476 type:complete len:155 (-) Transcript_9033:2514-2978(-)
MCFELFTRFIVFDSGSLRGEMLSFIQELIFRSMTTQEKTMFSFRVIDEFLSTSQENISQKSVLEALNQIGIPEGELISYMLSKLNNSQAKAKIDPFIFMSSVMILALNSLKHLQIPEPGLPLHLGIGCQQCHSKMIVGWRYKCGTCIGDVSFDA